MNSRITNIPSELVPTPGVAHRQVTVSTTVLPLNAQPAAGALNSLTTHVWFMVLAQPIRMTMDYSATDPSATVGMSYAASVSGVLRKEAWNAAEVIREGGTNATLAFQEMTH